MQQTLCIFGTVIVISYINRVATHADAAECGQLVAIFRAVLGLIESEVCGQGTCKLQGHRWAGIADRSVAQRLASLVVHDDVGVGLRKLEERGLCAAAAVILNGGCCTFPCLKRGKVGLYYAVVEAWHQAYVAITVIDGHKGCIGHGQRRVVVAFTGNGIERVTECQRLAAAVSARPAATAEGRPAEVGLEVVARRLVLDLQVVGVKAVLAFRLVVGFRLSLALGSIHSVAIDVGHLFIDVYIALHIPEKGIVGDSGDVTNRFLCDGQTARVLGILRTLLHEIGSSGGSLCIVAIGIFRFYIVSDVEVANHTALVRLWVVVAQRGGSALQIRSGYGVLMIAGLFGGVDVIMVFGHHGAVELLQFHFAGGIEVGLRSTLVDRTSHNLPTMLVDEHQGSIHLRGHEVERAVAHIDGHKPVLVLRITL